MRNKIIIIPLLTFILSMTILSYCILHIVSVEINKPILIEGAGNYTTDQIKDAVDIMNASKHNIIWYKSFAITAIISVTSISIMFIMLIWLMRHYKQSIMKSHPISGVVESLPIYISLKKDKFMKIIQGQGTMLKTLGIEEGEIIGKHPGDILPDYLIENIGFAWEDAFEGKSTNYVSHINGKTYNIIVRPVYGESEFDPRPISEVVSLAIDVSNTTDDISDPNKIRLSREMIMLKRIEKALQNASKYDHLAAIIVVQVQGIDILLNTFSKNQINSLVAKIAERVSENLRGGDSMIYTPDGKVTILLSHIKKKEFASYILQDIIRSICEPTFLDGYEVTVPVDNRMVLFPNENDAQLADIDHILSNVVG